MLNKKAYTLIEVLTVIIIIGIIIMIVVPGTKSSIDNSRKKAYEQNVTLIIDASKKWVIKNSNMLLNNNNSYSVTVDTLITDGFITNLKDGKLKNPKTDGYMDGCVVITYDDLYNQYQYEYNEEC